MNAAARWSLSAIVLAVYLASYLPPTFYNCSGGVVALGFPLLVLGWMGPGYGQYGWYANLIFVPLLVLFGPRERAGSASLILAAIMVGLAASSASVRSIPGDGGAAPVCGWGPGFYLWIGSIVGLALATVLKWIMAFPVAKPGG